MIIKIIVISISSFVNMIMIIIVFLLIVQVAQVSTHLAYTHFFIEPFAVAMHRCLLPVHPIHKMLKEHLRFIISSCCCCCC